MVRSLLDWLAARVPAEKTGTDETEAERATAAALTAFPKCC
jgi:hypothetical protein